MGTLINRVVGFTAPGAVELVVILIALVLGVAWVWCWCKVLSQAGYHWGWGLLILVPFVGAVFIPVWLALSEWPVSRRLRQMTMNSGT